MHLPAPHGHGYYTTFYVLAICTLTLLALVAGRRRGFALRPWLVLLACYLLAFIVGTKLVTMPLAAWGSLLHGGAWPPDTARSVLGGAVAGGLAVLALHRWLGLGRQVFDALALPLSAALAVQCVGCLLTGCCFGEVSSTGLVYAAGTPPWWAQVAAGLIPTTATEALPVAPTQLLALLLCLGTSLVLWATRHRRWPVGSWALLSTGLLLLGRFGLEFWRDAAGEPVGGQAVSLGGVTMLAMQWVLLPVALLALAGWAWQVWNNSVRQRAFPENEIAPARPLRHLAAIGGLLAVAALLGPGALTLPEILAVRGLLLAVLVLEGGAWLLSNRWSLGAPAWPQRLAALPLSLAAVFMLFTNQTTASDSTKNRDKDAVSKGLTITAGVQQNGYDDALEDDGSGCDDVGPTHQYRNRHRANVAGGQVAYRFSTKQNGELSTVGLGVWSGNERIRTTVQEDHVPMVDTTFHRPLFAVNPFVAGEFRRPRSFEFGYRAGLYIGQLGNTANNDLSIPGPMVKVLPDLMIWWGKRSWVYGQAELGYGPALLGPYNVRLGAGSGLGAANGSTVGLGFAVPVVGETEGEAPILGYLSANLRLPGTGLSVEPYAASNFDHFHQISLRLHYRISAKK
jgi:phosphatidylglycerol:prolipoprotein diacylglycerol transferase